MIIVFDLDSTLFDTETRKNFFYELTTLHGYEPEKGQKFYQEARQNNLKAHFTYEAYVRVLKGHLKQDQRVFREKRAEEIVKKMREEQGLLLGAKELLEFCKNQQCERYVVSLGVPAWQEEKIQQAKIDTYFEKDHIIFTENAETGKRDILKQFIDQNKIVLFNDRPDETRSLLDYFPQSIAYVRQEERDRRYVKEDFIQLKNDFQGRVMWSTDLKILHKHFENFFNTYAQ